MTSPPVRGLLCIGAVLAVLPLITLPAQTLPLALSAQVESSGDSLPDAPSASLFQQNTSKPLANPETTSPPQAVPPPNETDAERKARERAQAERDVKAEEKQRIGGVVPNFNVVLGGQALPLTPREKFDLAFHTIIDPYTIAIAGVAGGYGEVTDDHTGYGHGPAGYFKRAGAAYADSADGTLIGNAILPVILHQDPRYFRKGTGTIKSRIIYSALTTVICRSDAGKRQFNTSNVLGNLISGAISNAYYPANERGVGLTIENGLIVTLEGMLGAQILEFSPDVIDKIRRHRQAKRDATAAAQTSTSANP